MTPSQMNELAEKEYPIKSWMDVSTQIEVKNERAAFIHGLQHSSGQVKEDWISVMQNFIQWVMERHFWYDDEYMLWNKPDFGDEAEVEYTEDGQFRFTTQELYYVYLKFNAPNPPANQTLTEK